MNDRISDERLAELREIAFRGSTQIDMHTHDCLCELQYSRALVTDLRALAERMRAYEDVPDTCSLDDGYSIANSNWLDEIDSLLSAHGSAQADAEGKL